MNPYWEPYDKEGYVVRQFETESTALFTSPVDNPLWDAFSGSFSKSKYNGITNNLAITYKPITSLQATANVSFNKTFSASDNYQSSKHSNQIWKEDILERGQRDYNSTESSSWSIGGTVNYFKQWDKHILSAGFNMEFRESVTTSRSMSVEGFLNDEMNSLGNGHKYYRDRPSSSDSKSRAVGFTGTINYNYDNRYFFDASYRIDGASSFGSDSRFAPFWSLGAGWTVSNEVWMREYVPFINYMRLKYSFGCSGSMAFSPWQSQGTYTFGNGNVYHGSIAATIRGLENPDLKWQQTRNYNASLDFTMFHNIFSARFEYYEKYTKNTLLDYTMAPSVGFATMKENLGEISNKGYEVTLRLMPYSNAAKQAYWQVIFTGSHNKSRIEEISNALKVMNEKQMEQAMAYERPGDLEGKREKYPLPRYENGYSQTTIWVVRSMGIDPATGREVYMTRDGKLTNDYNAADQIPFGDSEPKFQGSVSTTFTYRGFSLTLAGQYHWGGQTFNKTLINKVENANLRLNTDRRALYDRWQKPGDHVFFKAIDGNVSKADTKESSRFVMDDNEFYFSTVNLSYRLDGKKFDWMKRVGITSATLGLYMEDICRFSTIKMERGIDYPFSRQISMSLNVVF